MDETVNDIKIRQAGPSDYSFNTSTINEWWGGRNVADMLPTLFFAHFRQTSFVAIQDENIVGFLVCFNSQTVSNEAYIHFAGVHPACRKKGIGHACYEHFFEAVKESGCAVVRCITSQGRVLFYKELKGVIL